MTIYFSLLFSTSLPRLAFGLLFLVYCMGFWCECVLGMPGDVLHACTFMDDVHVYVDRMYAISAISWDGRIQLVIQSARWPSVHMAPYLACTALKLPPPPSPSPPLLMSPLPCFLPMLLSSSFGP